MGQILEAMINQHVPVNICNSNMNNLHMCVNITVLAITEHLLWCPFQVRHCCVTHKEKPPIIHSVILKKILMRLTGTSECRIVERQI